MKLSFMMIAAAAASSCEHTSCTYVPLGTGLFRTKVSSNGDEKFSCGATAGGSDCACECADTFECTLNHLNGEGETKSFHHCAGPPPNVMVQFLLKLRSLHSAAAGKWAAITDDMNDVDLLSVAPLSYVQFDGSDVVKIGLPWGGSAVPTQLPSMDGLSTLRYFSWSKNPMNAGPIPSMKGCDSLETLLLDENKLTGTIPALELPKLKDLRLSKNALSGQFPSFDGTPQITNLDLNYNDLTGPVPIETFPPGVSMMKLQFNQLTGSLPPFSAFPSTVTHILLSGNLLSGEIPSQDGGSVKTVSIKNNNFSGWMPESLSTVTSLGYLDFSNTGIKCTYDFHTLIVPWMASRSFKPDIYKQYPSHDAGYTPR